MNVAKIILCKIITLASLFHWTFWQVFVSDCELGLMLLVLTYSQMNTSAVVFHFVIVCLK